MGEKEGKRGSGKMDFSDLRAFYDSGATRSFFARKAALEGLLSGVIRHEEALLRAMEEDLGKSRFEGYMTEVGLVRFFLH